MVPFSILFNYNSIYVIRLTFTLFPLWLTLFLRSDWSKSYSNTDRNRTLAELTYILQILIAYSYIIPILIVIGISAVGPLSSLNILEQINGQSTIIVQFMKAKI